MKKVLGGGMIAVLALGSATHAEAQQLQKPAGVPAQQQPQKADVTDWATVAEKAHEAAAHAVATWQLQARLQGSVQAMSLISTPGQLLGPPLLGVLQAKLTGPTVSAAKAAKFARVFSDAWKKWRDGYIIGGLPVYPAFAAYPGAAAPPMPNIPFPVGAGVSPYSAALSPGVLRDALRAEFPGANADMQRAFDAFSAAIETSFTAWLATTQVTYLLARGQVPTYAPPVVPVAPVLDGTVVSGPTLVGGSFDAGEPITIFDASLGSWKVKLENGKAYRGRMPPSDSRTVARRVRRATAADANRGPGRQPVDDHTVIESPSAEAPSCSKS